MKYSKTLSLALIVAGATMTLGLPNNIVKNVEAGGRWPTSLADCQERFERISFCHATHAENNPYNFHYNQPCTAAFGSGQGQSGHFEEDGTPAAGHEFPEFGTADFFTDDNDVTCGGEIDPTPTPTPTPTVEPTSTPKPSTTPTPTPESNVRVYFSTIDPSCDSDQITAQAHIQKDNIDQSGVRVVFKYLGFENIAYTGNNGRTGTNFTYKGDGPVEIQPDGFPSDFHNISKETDCSSDAGEVLGASTQGQVLGATTYAETGIAEDVMMALMGLAGAGMFTTGAVLNGKNKS